MKFNSEHNMNFDHISFLASLAVVALLAGCAQFEEAQKPKTNQLVRDWFGPAYNKNAGYWFAASPHYCQYQHGPVLEVGWRECPWAI